MPTACHRAVSRSGPTVARLLGALLSAVLVASPAAAHPHLRFGWQVQPRHEAGAITALRIHWLLDPMTTLLVVRGIDVDRSGSIEPGELQAFAEQNDRLVAESGYFLELGQDGRTIAFSVSRGLAARFDGRQIGLDFEVALERPVVGPLSMRLFDRSWYVALTASDPVIPAGAADDCAAVTGVDALATEGWGVQQVPVARLSCGGATDDDRSTVEPFHDRTEES